MKRINFIKSILGVGVVLLAFSCQRKGCTDPLATNYNPKANHEDNSCVYSNTNTGGGGGGTGGSTVTDNVTATTTWGNGSVVVCGDIYVSAPLTIAPGTTVTMCANSSIIIESTGSITAVGSITEPIIFKGETGTSAFWRGIKVNSNNPLNNFQYVTVKDAGGYWAFENSNVHLAGSARMSFSSTTFSNSANVGLYVDQGATLQQFANNVFASNGTHGLDISANHMGSLDEATNYNAGNITNIIYVRAADVSTTQTWVRTTTPYLFNGDTDITAAVTVNPGVNLKMEAGSRIDVETAGSFNANGSASMPIVIEGRFATPGYWNSLTIRSNNPNNRLSYVTIKDGGEYWGDDYCTLFLYGSGRVEMTNSSVMNSNSWGMIVGSSATVTCNGSTQTTEAGVLSFNTATGNGVGSNANCTSGCGVLFQ